MLLLRDEKARAAATECFARHREVIEKVYAGQIDMRALHAAKLMDTVMIAARSKLYAGLDRGGLGKYVPNGEPDLKAILEELFPSLPLLDKHELSEHGFDAFTRTNTEFLHYYESSGTTGDPVAAPKALDDLITNTMNIGEMWGRILSPDDVALILINAPFAPAAYQFEKVLEYLGVMSLRPWVDNVSGDYTRVLRLVRDLPVNVFVGPPSRLLDMVQFASRRGMPLPRLDHLFLIAEQTGPHFLRHLERLTGGKAYVGAYGASEIGTTAATCEHGQLHLQLQSYLLELHSNGETRLLEGATDHGELVVTTLDLPARPLVRYRTGDLIDVDGTPCSCGLALPVMHTRGREQDALRVTGVDVRQDDVEAVLWADGAAGPTVLNYMLVIQGEEVVVLVTTDQPVDADWTGELVGRLGSLFPTHRLDVRPVDALPPLASLGGYLGWKLSRVLDMKDEQTWDRLPAPIAAVLRTSLAEIRARLA